MKLTDAAAEWSAIAQRFDDVVHRVANWDAPTPVAAWTVRDVVDHLCTWFPPFLAGGCDVTLTPGPSAAEDPVAAWEHLDLELVRVLADPANSASVFRNPHIGEMPVPAAVSRFFTSDVFLHTWDLARAAGLDDRLDEKRCAAMFDGMEPMKAALYASGHYGPEVLVPADAPIQRRLLGLIGRDPDWRP